MSWRWPRPSVWVLGQESKVSRYVLDSDFFSLWNISYLHQFQEFTEICGLFLKFLFKVGHLPYSWSRSLREPLRVWPDFLPSPSILSCALHGRAREIVSFASTASIKGFPMLLELSPPFLLYSMETQGTVASADLISCHFLPTLSSLLQFLHFWNRSPFLLHSDSVQLLALPLSLFCLLLLHWILGPFTPSRIFYLPMSV